MTNIEKGSEVLLICHGRYAGKHKAIVTKSGSKYIHVQRIDSKGELWGREQQFETKTLFSTNTTGVRDFIIPSGKIQEYEDRQRLVKKQTLVSSLLKKRLDKLDEAAVDKLIEILIRE